MRSESSDPLFKHLDGRCALRGCSRYAEWRLLGTDEAVGFCRHHRDLIEDEGLDLIEDG